MSGDKHHELLTGDRRIRDEAGDTPGRTAGPANGNVLQVSTNSMKRKGHEIGRAGFMPGNSSQTPTPGDPTVDARRVDCLGPAAGGEGGSSLPFIFWHASASVIGLGLQDHNQIQRLGTTHPLNHTADSQREQQP